MTVRILLSGKPWQTLHYVDKIMECEIWHRYDFLVNNPNVKKEEVVSIPFEQIEGMEVDGMRFERWERNA